MALFGKSASATSAPTITPAQNETFAQLIEDRNKIDHAIRARQQIEIENVKRSAATLSSVLGITVSELLGVATATTDRKPRKSREVAPKFRHPTNDQLTWSGRGKLDFPRKSRGLF